MPGMLVLRNDGFQTSANPIVTVTGFGSLIMAPFGSHAFNIAAITAAITTGREAHEDPSKRWIAGMAAGCFYILVGVFGVTLAAVFMALPATFITALAGLALLGAIGGSSAGAMADPNSREAALITFWPLLRISACSVLAERSGAWSSVSSRLSYLMGNYPVNATTVHQSDETKVVARFY